MHTATSNLKRTHQSMCMRSILKRKSNCLIPFCITWMIDSVCLVGRAGMRVYEVSNHRQWLVTSSESWLRSRYARCQSEAHVISWNKMLHVPGSAWEACRIPGSAAVDRFNYSILLLLLFASGPPLVLGLNLSFEFCWGQLSRPDMSLLHLCICHPFPYPFEWSHFCHVFLAPGFFVTGLGEYSFLLIKSVRFFSGPIGFF